MSSSESYKAVEEAHRYVSEKVKYDGKFKICANVDRDIREAFKTNNTIKFKIALLTVLMSGTFLDGGGIRTLLLPHVNDCYKYYKEIRKLYKKKRSLFVVVLDAPNDEYSTYRLNRNRR